MLALTGCTGSSSPTPTTPSAAETPSPTPTPTMPEPAPSPTLPPDIKDRDVDGAEAAARYFLDLYTYTLNSQDTAAWDAMSYDGCVFCESVSDGVRDQKAQGLVTRGGAMVVIDASTEKLDPQAYAVSLDVTQEAQERWSEDSGTLLDTGQGWEGTAYLVMYQEGDGWFTRAVQTFAPGEAP